MAVVERRVCDLDQREVGVETISITDTEGRFTIDLCDRCQKSRISDLRQHGTNVERPARRRGKIVKTEVILK